jgi:hypothetical protein
MPTQVISSEGDCGDLEFIRNREHTSLPPMTTIKTIAAAAASLAAGATLMSVAGPAAQANPYNTFGDAGGCDSVAIGGGNFNGGGFIAGRDCGDHRDWASREARRNRQHDTQTQLIGLGGGLLGQIINGSQQRQQAASVSSSELALLRQQQEIELLKMQLQMQQQPGYGYQTVNYVPAPQAPVYHQPAYGYQQQSSYQQHSGYVQRVVR